jgi:hypothetical protein
MVERSFAHVLDRHGMRARLAARTREYPQALPVPCRRVPSRRPDTRHVRYKGRRGRLRKPYTPRSSFSEPKRRWLSA